MPRMKRILFVLLFAALSSAAYGIDQPYVYPQTVGTTASSVLPANPARKQIFFHNPNASATVAVCPAVSRKDGSAITCAVNGAGSRARDFGSILRLLQSGNIRSYATWVVFGAVALIFVMGMREVMFR